MPNRLKKDNYDDLQAARGFSASSFHEFDPPKPRVMHEHELARMRRLQEPSEALGVTAPDILNRARKHMEDRAKTYDKPGGERSIGATVEAFRAVTGDGEMNSEERGWLFMELLKMVRSQQGEYKADNYEDGTAYSALRGESAAKERG